jgi:non-reducing end alpha-L-arabinofuranosidase
MKNFSWSIRLNVIVSAIVVLGLAREKTPAAGPCPCDIYAASATPCVAAHSTVRSLYAAYSGPLYQVKRKDGKTLDIGALSPGGFANSAAQDSFLSGTTGTISIIYDQSAKANHLTVAPKGTQGTANTEASATGIKLTVSGHSVYGVYDGGKMGYRNNKTSGIATGDQPEGMYMVASGKHVNNGCCYDYGNAETNNADNGNGTMEAIYLGTCTGWGKGSGSGPWVMADLENGLFAGQKLTTEAANTSVAFDYVTAMIKGKPGRFAIKGGDAQKSGGLKTMYDGARPTTTGYNPMKKEGAIILGIGGDNSNTSQGTFFEGCMTAGYPPDSADSAVHENIVSAGYGGKTITRQSENSIFPTPHISVGGNSIKAIATVSFTLSDARTVSLNISDLHGRLVAVAANGTMSAGRHEVIWGGGRVPPGVYVLRMAFDNKDRWAGKIVIGK